MSEKQDSTKIAEEALAKVADPRYVIIDASSGQVEGRKFHQYLDCGFLDKQPPEEIEVIGEREIRLLGIKVCSVCEKRASGGPAIDALCDALHGYLNGVTAEDERTIAFNVVNALKERGVYLAVRKAK